MARESVVSVVFIFLFFWLFFDFTSVSFFGSKKQFVQRDVITSILFEDGSDCGHGERKGNLQARPKCGLVTNECWWYGSNVIINR